MPFEIETAGDVVVVAVVGQLVVGNRQEFKQSILDEVERGARRILVDFSQTGYVDSSGLGALVSLNKRLREAGGELRLHLADRHHDIAPNMGTSVIFLSEEIEHEVLPATQTRYSIAAWLRQREIKLR